MKIINIVLDFLVDIVLDKLADILEWFNCKLYNIIEDIDLLIAKKCSRDIDLGRRELTSVEELFEDNE